MKIERGERCFVAPGAAGRMAFLALFLVVALALGFGEGRAWAVVFNKGDVFAGVGNGLIKHFSPTGTLIETLDTTSGSTYDTGMCFDSSGNLYSTNFATSTMSKFDHAGALLSASWGSGFNALPESCVVDSAQNVYVGQAGGSNQVLKFNSSGTPSGSFSPALEARGTDWIDLAADQCTLLYTSEGNSVKRFNVCTNTQLTDFATGLTGPCFALRIRPNGEVMVACLSQVYRLNSDGSVHQTYPISDGSLFALNLDPDGTHFWTGGESSGNIYKIDIDTGNGSSAPLFNAGAPVELDGLSVFGEITASQPPQAPASIPTMTEWGMIAFMFIAGLVSVYYLRRRLKKSN